jgi:hypothetical protein
MTTQWLKLKDNHPTMVKLMKLYDLADELGIRILFGMRTIVDDDARDPNLPPLFLEDIERPGDRLNEWPPSFEFKVIYENPEYLAELKRAEEERQKKLSEERRLQFEATKARIKAEDEAKRIAEEQRERAELARLKSKYGE